MTRVANLLCLLVVACTSPFEPDGAVPFDPPDWYALEYHDVEQCTGLSFPYDLVEWWTVPGKYVVDENGLEWSGLWSSGTNSITIASEKTYSHWLVRHETIHLLTRSVKHTGKAWECE